MITKTCFTCYILFIAIFLCSALCLQKSSMGGTIETGVLNSTRVGHDVDVSVYLPEGYSTSGEPYRLLIFLHGGAGDTPPRSMKIMRPVPDDLIGAQTMDTATTDVRFVQKSILPVVFQLDQNYPNPFNASTTISFHFDKAGHVVLTITNVLGETIDIPINRLLSKGDHRVIWDALDQPGGLYFYTMKTAVQQMTKKLVIVR